MHALPGILSFGNEERKMRGMQRKPPNLTSYVRRKEKEKEKEAAQKKEGEKEGREGGEKEGRRRGEGVSMEVWKYVLYGGEKERKGGGKEGREGWRWEGGVDCGSRLNHAQLCRVKVVIRKPSGVVWTNQAMCGLEHRRVGRFRF